MFIFLIFAGIVAIIVGAYLLREAGQIPEGEVTRRGFATYWSREMAYLQAATVISLGVLLAILGAVFL